MSKRLVRAELERWLRESARARKLTKAVLSSQRALRRAVDDKTWRLYLALEARVNRRHDAIVSAAIRMASRRR